MIKKKHDLKVSVSLWHLSQLTYDQASYILWKRLLKMIFFSHRCESEFMQLEFVTQMLTPWKDMIQRVYFHQCLAMREQELWRVSVKELHLSNQVSAFYQFLFIWNDLAHYVLYALC